MDRICAIICMYTPTDYTDDHLRRAMVLTDGQTDSQTDGRYQAHYLLASLSYTVDNKIFDNRQTTYLLSKLSLVLVVHSPSKETQHLVQGPPDPNFRGQRPHWGKRLLTGVVSMVQNRGNYP